MTESQRTPEQKEYMRKSIAASREAANAMFEESRYEKKRNAFYKENGPKLVELCKMIEEGSGNVEIAAALNMSVPKLMEFKNTARYYNFRIPFIKRGRKKF